MSKVVRTFIILVAWAAAWPAWAQTVPTTPQPDEAFVAEWSTVQATDLMAASAHKHVAELAQQLVLAHRAQREALEATKKRIGDLDAYLKACGDKPGCTVPAE